MRDLRNLPNLPLGLRHNNPGNIRPAQGRPWVGQVGVVNTPNGQFVEFGSLEYGIRAMLKDLLTKYNRGLNTLEKIITAWAPPEDNNNTKAYIRFVSSITGLQPSEVIQNFGNRLPYIALAMIYQEQGRGVSQYINDSDIHNALLLLKEKIKDNAKTVAGGGIVTIIIIGLIAFFYGSKN